MSANNMSDEELDDLFRKSAEMYEPPFEPEAWAAMDRKLDNAQGGAGGIRRFSPMLLLALLLSIMLFWSIAEQPEPAPKQLVPAAKNEERLADKSIATPGNPEKKEHTAKPEPANPIADHPYAKAGSGAVLNGTSESITKKNRTDVGSDKTHPEQAVIAVKDKSLTEPDLFEGKAETLAYEVADLAMLPEVSPLADTAKQIAQKPAEAATEADSSQQKRKKEHSFLKSITLSLAVAPDITTVRFKDPDAISTNSGLLLSLPLTSHLNIITGALWATKLYNATAQDYEPYPGFWDGRTLPDAITANCKVLDIPVNLQYKMLERGKNILTAEVGVSSYLMVNEKYTYTYQHPGSKPYSKTKEIANENEHWLGVQNLAIGYTRMLSPAISVGAQPFVKLPLASIGAGNVKLTSAGIIFTAGYTLQLKK
jgi:hypothetical protein